MPRPIDIGDLEKKLKDLASRYEGNAKDLVDDAIIATGSSVVQATPADTGEARSNWIGNAGAPYRGTIEAHFPGKNLGTGELQNAQAAIAQIRRSVRKRKAGESFYLSNNTRQIFYLNNPPPASKQAPAFFVEQATLAARTVFAKGKMFKKR